MVHTFFCPLGPTRLTPMSCDFFNWKNFTICSYMQDASRKGFSGMYMHGSLEEYMLRSLHGLKFSHS